jgi:hypothetical protein
MTKEIWKYKLDMPMLAFAMPAGAEVLCVQVQDEIPCIWGLVNPVAPPKERYFEIKGTGHKIDGDCSDKKYIGTWQESPLPLVWHLFECLTKPEYYK